jgi:hypothetical protein
MAGTRAKMAMVKYRLRKETTSASAERTTTSVWIFYDRGPPELGKSAPGRWIPPPPGAPFLLLAIAAARGTPVDSSNQGRPTKPPTSPRLPPPRAPPTSQTPPATLLCWAAPSCSTPAVDPCRMVSHPIRSYSTSHKPCPEQPL